MDIFEQNISKMKLEEMLELEPSSTLLLVIDIQKDFLEDRAGFTFFDAGNDTRNMRGMVIYHLAPLIQRSLENNAHVAYAQAEYPEEKFPQPYDRLCSKQPGKDFYLIDMFDDFGRVKVFRKEEHDPFTNNDLRIYVQQNSIRNLILTGVTLTHCIDVAANSAFGMQGLMVIVPEDCVGYRIEREADAQRILAAYKSADKRIVVVNSGQIKYT